VTFGSEWNLGAELDALEADPDAHGRGRRFERVIARLFSEDRFEVKLNPGTAQPRQTDVIAVRGNERYIIECKWLSSKATINDSDNLRARLRRTFGAIGILISMDGFSETVIDDVSRDRNPPILLVSGHELRNLTWSKGGLLELLWRKHEALFTQGRAVVEEPAEPPSIGDRPELPGSPVRFVDDRRNPDPVTNFPGHFGPAAFALEVQDVDWVPASGNGVTLDVALPSLSEDGILDLLSKLADLGWASPDGCWSIHQTHAAWYGFGAAAFADTLPDWRRPAESEHAHHSEEFCYVDRCLGGFYSLTATIPAHEHRRAHSVVLSFQFQGIPLDTSPLLQLCRALGVHSEVYFRPRDAKSVTKAYPPFWMQRIDHVHSIITVPDPLLGRDLVCGLVIRNPLRDPRWRDELQRSDSERADLDRLRGLESLDYLICSLLDFHEAHDGRTYSYGLRYVEMTRTSEARILRPVVHWEYADEKGDKPQYETAPSLETPTATGSGRPTNGGEHT
jgi:hypothetical protein